MVQLSYGNLKSLGVYKKIVIEIWIKLIQKSNRK